MTNPAYHAYRERNNAASRISRERAREARRHSEWATEHPELSEIEKAQARRFLMGHNVPLTPKVKGILRKHIVAARGHARAGYARMLDRLDRVADA